MNIRPDPPYSPPAEPTESVVAPRAHSSGRKTVSIMQACNMVGVSRRTIYNWIAAGKVEYVRTAGGSIRLFEDSLWRGPERQT